MGENKKMQGSIKKISYALLALCCFFVAAVTYFLYQHTSSILEERLKERLKSITATASIGINPDDVEEISDASSVSKETYKNLVDYLQLIRNYNSNIQYVYILRPTTNPDIFEYVADADSRDPTAVFDLNNDGKINEEDELNTPGDEYDVSEISELRNESLLYPTTDAEPVGDQWGLFLSSYAPIKKNGLTIAVLGIDVEITDYYKLIERTFIPFSIFIVFLLTLLSILTIGIVNFWKKELNAVEELDRQKDELLSIVSHQLATPVSSLKWYTEMLIDGDLGKITKDQKEHLVSMQGVAGNLSDLVSMILDVSRIQLGRIRVEKQELDLNVFFKEILEIIEPKAIEKEQKFTIVLPKNLPKAMLDRRYTHMTIENLLSNAIKYTPAKGKVDFTVEIKVGTLFCTVADTGCGIPKADQEKIFGKLFRASNVRNTVDGNGFGLFVAKGAVEAQGGKISFQSTEGKGTTFFVQLPVR